jgi:curved DNA-binding protein CbpA
VSDLEQLRRLVGRLHEDLDVLTYYNLLGLLPGATEPEIRTAFRERARLLHPDRYFGLTDEPLKAQIGAVYKRLAEGHRVLCRASKRQAYDALVRQGTLRYSDKAAEAAGIPENAGITENAGGTEAARPSGPGVKPSPGGDGDSDGAMRHPQVRQFYSYGKEALARQDFSTAISYFEQALAVQPDATKVRARLDEALRLKKLYG